MKKYQISFAKIVSKENLISNYLIKNQLMNKLKNKCKNGEVSNLFIILT